jgi:SAM-dependent methyltransferase
VRAAAESLTELLGGASLEGRSFADVGSGSGLFSLAAARLGAARVHSLDFDARSVACTRELRERFGAGGCDWTVEQASVLDLPHLRALGSFDVVYCWGVVHHTGDMWTALGNVCELVSPGGLLLISIYNDQGRRSRVWRRVKRSYNRLPRLLRPLYVAAAMAPSELRGLAGSLLHRRSYLAGWREPRERGMSKWRDMVDWVGGYPFEVATPDEVHDFIHARGFALERLRTQGAGLGCNEYVYRR